MAELKPVDKPGAKDPANKTMSAQKLLDINAEQGVFGPNGMSVINILDKVDKLGYKGDIHTNSDLEALKIVVIRPSQKPNTGDGE